MLINIILVIVIIILGYLLLTYNSFIRLDNKVKENESGIDILLKQRFDLIPNIVECVKAYSNHENSTLTELAELRSNYNNNGFNFGDIDNINKKFNNILALQEAYPELKADSQFLNLQRNLREIEDKILNARNRYNRYITAYNNKVQTFPSELIAKIFNFNKKDFYKLDNEDERNNIKFDFN